MADIFDRNGNKIGEINDPGSSPGGCLSIVCFIGFVFSSLAGWSILGEGISFHTRTGYGLIALAVLLLFGFFYSLKKNI
ncbi:hypothetical protein [Fibrisoma limi]|uniref:hypothetical protein n=1 Tax=Fibrisoma limi TaxID=663275 RepID=UPI001181779C|nr:hypothetical protein [Fibrisoma limi]